MVPSYFTSFCCHSIGLGQFHSCLHPTPHIPASQCRRQTTFHYLLHANHIFHSQAVCSGCIYFPAIGGHCLSHPPEADTSFHQPCMNSCRFLHWLEWQRQPPNGSSVRLLSHHPVSRQLGQR